MPTTAHKLTISPSASRAAFRELDVVRLVDDLKTPFSSVPRGTEGTVLLIFDAGIDYLVEFDQPYSEPQTVPASLLEAVVDRAA